MGFVWKDLDARDSWARDSDESINDRGALAADLQQGCSGERPMSALAVHQYNSSSGDDPPDDILFGSSSRMQLVRKRIDQFAGLNIPVHIEGEVGSGKEVIARYIHRHSRQANGIFIPVRCPTMSLDVFLDGETFGEGCFRLHINGDGEKEHAPKYSSGTLFLDEVSQLSAGVQRRISDWLDQGQPCRFGHPRRIGYLRVVSATTRNYLLEAPGGTIPPTLLFKLEAVAIQLPPLRERLQDVSAIAEYFLQRYGRRHNCKVPRLTSSALQALKEHNWPGNIRELQNMMMCCAAFGAGEMISLLRSQRINSP